MKIIFLDFDGVLRTYRSITSPAVLPENADPECVAALNKIIAETKAQIVVSSSWRGKFKAPMQRLLKGWTVAGKVCGVTPRLERKEGLIYISPTRGVEIQHWLDEHGPVESFVILDDEDHDFGELRSRLVQTEFNSGLTLEHAEKAIAMLR